MGYLVRLHAVNEGGSTAEGVVIEGVLRRGMEKAETSHTTLDFLPARSEKRGGLFFTLDPRTIGLSYPRMKLKHCFSFRTALDVLVDAFCTLTHSNCHSLSCRCSLLS